VGVAAGNDDGGDFGERLTELNDELTALNAEARQLDGRIARNVGGLLESGR